MFDSWELNWARISLTHIIIISHVICEINIKFDVNMRIEDIYENFVINQKKAKKKNF